jgi:carbonic anhydrase
MNKNFLENINKFQEKHFAGNKTEFERLVAEGQSPKTLFIGCSDSRVIPELLTSSKPGDLFVVRNIGNIVPTYETGLGYHGVTAAIEYAVEILNVKDIIICGHSHCGAIRALYEPPEKTTSNISNWLNLAKEAKKILPENEIVDEPTLRETEQKSVLIQMERLAKFPTVREKLDKQELRILGWHYFIETGKVKMYNQATNQFE